MSASRPSSDNPLKLAGQVNEAEGYALRDFLQRSGVPFEWKEDTGDLQVTLPDGQRLKSPTVNEVAEKLGLTAEPSCIEYDLSIYGAGPAGISAAVYAALEGLKTVLVERDAVGGQAGSTSRIENYLGFPEGISGADLAERAREQALKFNVDLIILKEGVEGRFKDGRIYSKLSDGRDLVANANICATGVEWRRLCLPNEDKFLNCGMYYGVGVSEASLCKGEDVYIVGGGNSAGQAAVHLSRFARSVNLIVREENLADSMSQYLKERLAGSDNILVQTNAIVTDLDGDDLLERVQIESCDETNWVDTSKLFVAIGGTPQTEWAATTPIERDSSGYLITGPDLLENGRPPGEWALDRLPYFLETSVPGSFAAGDVRHGSVKRVATAAGEGAMAVSFVHKYLEENH